MGTKRGNEGGKGPNRVYSRQKKKGMAKKMLEAGAG